MDKPVRGSPLVGISTPSAAGTRPANLILSSVERERRTASSDRRRLSPKPIGASEVVSTPPAAATS